MTDSLIFAFEDYELDTARRELRHAGQMVEIEPKAFDLLAYLLTNSDRAVSKDELSSEVWPNTIVTETALTRCVMKARRAIADSANEQRLIKTLHGHGYGFVGQLKDSAQALAESPVSPDSVPAQQTNRSWRMGTLAIVGLLLVAAAGWYWSGDRTSFELNGDSLAILPVIDATDEAELKWTSLGLMSLMNRMATDAGLSTTGDQAVLNALGEHPTQVSVSKAELDVLQRRLGAGLVLTAALDKQAGLYELTFQLSRTDGQHLKRIIVGDAPAVLAAEAIAIIDDQIKRRDEAAEKRLRRVSDDPFVNEAYARALDLELQGHYGEARDLFRAASQQAPEVFWLRYEAALCTRELREWEASEIELEGLLKEAAASGDVSAEVAVMNSMAVTALKRQQYARAQVLLSKALELVSEGAYPKRRATVHLNLALVAKNLDDAELARSHTERSLIAFNEAGIDAPPTLLNNFAGLLMREGDLDTALEYSQQAVSGFRMRGQRAYEAYSLNRLGNILRRRGDYEAAEQRHQQAKAIHEAVDNREGATLVTAALTNLYQARGELSRAAANAEAVIVEAKLLESPLLVSDSLMQLAQIASLREQPAEAMTNYVAAARIFDASGELNGLRSAHEGLAHATIKSGDLTSAQSAIEQLLAAALEREHPAAIHRATYLQALWLAESGRNADALVLLGELRQKIASEQQTSPLRVDVDVLAARLHIEAGDIVAATEDLAAHQTDDDWDTLRQRARLAVALGEADRARNLLSNLAMRSGEAFTQSDQALLQSLRQSTGRNP